MRFGFVTVVTVNITVFWDVASYKLLVASVSEEVATSVFRIQRYIYNSLRVWNKRAYRRGHEVTSVAKVICPCNEVCPYLFGD
jgi:hypothetical protein